MQASLGDWHGVIVSHPRRHAFCRAFTAAANRIGSVIVARHGPDGALGHVEARPDPDHNVRDPEGLLSSLPVIGTAPFGVRPGAWLRQLSRGLFHSGMDGVS
jgi:hypothetical protein